MLVRMVTLHVIFAVLGITSILLHTNRFDHLMIFFIYRARIYIYILYYVLCTGNNCVTETIFSHKVVMNNKGFFLATSYNTTSLNFA